MKLAILIWALYKYYYYYYYYGKYFPVVLFIVRWKIFAVFEPILLLVCESQNVPCGFWWTARAILVLRENFKDSIPYWQPSGDPRIFL